MVDAVLTKNGLELSISQLLGNYGPAGYKSLLNKFTIKIKSPVGSYFISKKNYSVDGQSLVVPRFASSSLLKAGIVKTIDNRIGDTSQIELEYLGAPTENQQVVADFVMESFDKLVHESGVTIKMIAGSGKTFLAMHLISLIKRRTIVVVPNTYLLQQWRSLLIEFFPNAKIGVYYGKEKKDGDVLIAIVNSLCKPFVNGVDPEFGLAIFDESHSYCTDKFKCIYKRIQSKRMLGLSATPNEREDKTDIISHLNVGRLVDAESLQGYKPDESSFDSEVKIIRYSGPQRDIISQATGLACVPLMIAELIEDNDRNCLIINEIIRLLGLYEDMNVFVFSERRSHCELLEQMFADAITGESAVTEKITMYGGCKPESIEFAKITARVIFTTYAYSSTGVSIEKLTGLVLATPRRSKSRQIIGRIFRNKKEYADKKRHIVDIVDVNNCLGNQLYGRMPAYKERNSAIVTTEFTCEPLTS